MNSEPRSSGKSNKNPQWLCLCGGLRGTRGWRKVNGAALRPTTSSPSNTSRPPVPNTAQRCRRHFAGWAAQAFGARPARQSGRGRGGLKEGIAHYPGKHACAPATAAAEGWGRGTSAPARWEPAEYLKEVGGEVERSEVEERLRARATGRGGCIGARARKRDLRNSREISWVLYMDAGSPRPFPGVIPSCAAAGSNSSRLIPSGFSPT